MRPTLHTRTEQAIQALLRSPAGSWIFAGPDSVGRRSTALWLARALHGHPDAVQDCRRCRQIANGSSPDTILVSPGDKGSIGIAAVQEIQHGLSLSRHDNTLPYRLVIIDGAENLTLEAQNAFLKRLEEPPADTLIILVTSDPTKLLETVRSRCRVVQFHPLGHPQVEERLQLLLSEPTFERLVSAGQDVSDIGQFCNQVSVELSLLLRQTDDRTKILAITRSQEALERLYIHTKANVSSKTALSAFILELA